jgi:hypothetical protein
MTQWPTATSRGPSRDFGGDLPVELIDTALAYLEPLGVGAWRQGRLNVGIVAILVAGGDQAVSLALEFANAGCGIAVRRRACNEITAQAAPKIALDQLKQRTFERERGPRTASAALRRTAPVRAHATGLHR